jgi:hypothetical protein
LAEGGDPSTYGHSQLKTGHPVRSAIHKQLNGRLVLRWVTTWESLLLYVLFFARSLLIVASLSKVIARFYSFGEIIISNHPTQSFLYGVTGLEDRT